METISRWLAQNTYHHSVFAGVGELVAEKRRQGRRISVAIPTWNEAQTIGEVVGILRRSLVEEWGLVDELAVIDSGSTDGTCEVAARAGAEVFASSAILPETGTRRGKGENLWKAVYQLTGDIICYIDGDISNIHPRFVYGLVGPLIARAEVHYVKAFYDRPMAFPEKLHPTGGGRVTEILVRPLFSLFFPELTALIQPLSGEYAVRRAVLEAIPFPVGYGVETAHLLDVYHEYGLGAFAQTDLDERVHRNQSTYALGRMAFGVLQTFQRRLERYGIVSSLVGSAWPTVLRQFQAQSKDYEQVVLEILEEERPPWLSLPQYREKFGRLPVPSDER